MKKTITITFALCLVALLALCLVACSNNENPSTPTTPSEAELLKFQGISFDDATVDFDGKEHEIFASGVPEGATVEYSNNKAVNDGTYNATATIKKDGYETLTLNAKLTIKMTADAVVAAKDAAMENSVQNYDFNIHLAGTINVSGFSGTANANYDGKYRYNADTNALSFHRVTSGALIYDSNEYIYNSGSNKIKIVANEDGVAKKLSVVPKEEVELNLLNIPFVEVIKHTQANNLSGITKLSSGKYAYKANLALASDNIYLNKILTMLGKLGATIDFKDVEFSNPANGIDFYFNMNSDKTSLTDYKYAAKISFPIKGVGVTLDLIYEQNANNSIIKIPSVNGFITTENGKKNELTIIDKAIDKVKNANTYSLNVEAKNEFDPGWNVSATTDKYIATLFKNTTDGRVDFNHSYEYKAHHEEDGKENYKYTLANLKDGTTHLVSRKGSNVIMPVENVSVDDRFDYLLSVAGLGAGGIDCIAKEVNGESTLYHIHMNTAATLGVQDNICDIINSNEADGVVDVENYFTSNNSVIRNSEMVVEIVNGEIVSIKVETENRYNPTGGEYTETQVTLNNTIVIDFNRKLDDASEYVAPDKTNTTIGSFGLNNSKYYIN